MFERIKAYKKLKKADKFMNGVKRMAEITNDDEALKLANETLYLNEKLRKNMWKNRKVAVNYNLECIKNGL